jgi:hypothetical protein
MDIFKRYLKIYSVEKFMVDDTIRGYEFDEIKIRIILCTFVPIHPIKYQILNAYSKYTSFESELQVVF